MHIVTRMMSVAALAALAACAPQEQRKEGELGKGEFIYRCAEASADLQCDPYTDPEQFPQFMAVGSRFELDYEANEGSAAGVAPASTGFADSEGNGRFRLVKEGKIAFIARAFGEVIDFIHLDVRPVGGVVVFDEQGLRQRTISLKVGEPLDLWARVVDDREIRLSGAMTYAWSIEHPAVAEIEGDMGHGQATITPKEAGESTVSIEVDEQVFELPLEVEE